MAGERLQKLIAQAGITSRRNAEQWIKAGRVRLNGRVVTELGTRADIRKDKVEVDGRKIQLPRTWTYIIMNKPAGTVTTAKDEFDRRTVLDVLKGVKARVFPVGRLDLDTEGALLITNDGDVAAALAPQFPDREGVSLQSSGTPDDAAIDKLTRGVVLEDGFAQATQARRMPSRVAMEKNSWIEITVVEGRNHLIKRMCESIGHPVVRLQRRSFAGLSCPDLKPGEWRNLKQDELKKLKALTRTAKRRRGPTSQ